MDGDISRWILEFLLRSSVPDSLIRKIVTVLPLSDGDSRLKKTLLLRTLQSQLYKASVTETTLEILEFIEEIDRKDAIAVTDTMKQAYCAVAVECTVKYLAACPENACGEYFEAVKRIWRGRVKEMEAAESTGSELFSGELNQWMDEIEAAVWDAGVCERLANMNSRRDALNKVKRYLKEAWEIMGPSFLDSVATLSNVKGLRSVGGNTVRDERGDRIESDDGAYCIEEVPVTGANLDKEHLEERVEERHLGVCESAFAAEPMSKCDGRLESSANTRRDVVDVDRIKSDDGACCMEEAPVTGANQNKEQLGERVEASVEGSQESGECDSPTRREKAIQKGKLLPKRKHSALRRCYRGVKISDIEEVSPAKPGSKYDPLPSPEVNEVRESLKSSSLELRALVKDPLPDALHMSEVVRMELATKDKNLEPPSENQSRDVDVPDPNICKSIVLYQPKLPNDANLGKKSSVHCSYAHRPSFMERKSTARTYEWDDSIGNLPQVTLPRRKKRKWTSLEEETLRAGVQKFGEGSWATIRNFYSDIFENRSGVDLKDKWRNMMR